MYHTSVNLTFGRDEKIFGVQLKLQGRQKAYKGRKKPVSERQKKRRPCFYFFGNNKKIVGAPKISAGCADKW